MRTHFVRLSGTTKSYLKNEFLKMVTSINFWSVKGYLTKNCKKKKKEKKKRVKKTFCAKNSPNRPEK